MKANPLTALSRQPGLLGRAVLPQLLDIPEQTARQVEATMCLHVSAISKCLAHLCSNFGPVDFGDKQSKHRGEHRKRKQYEIY